MGNLRARVQDDIIINVVEVEERCNAVFSHGESRIFRVYYK